MRQRLRTRTLNFGCARSRFQRSIDAFLAKLLSLPLPKRHSESRQQASRLVVVPRGCDDRHLEPAQLVDLVVIDLWEHDLLAQAQRVITAPVESIWRHAAEVADARQRDVQQLVQEVPHAAAAEGRLDADRLPLPELERGHRFPGFDQLRLLARDGRDVADSRVERLVVVLRLADADVDHDLVEARYLHHVAVVELLGHLLHDGVAVRLKQARRRFRLGAGSLRGCFFLGSLLLGLGHLLLGLRLSYALVWLAAVPADQRASAGFEHGVLGPRRSAAAGADEHHVGVVERGFEVDDSTLGDLRAAPPRARLGVAFEDVDPLDHDLVIVWDRAQNLALLALVLARDDDHGIAGRKLQPAALRFGLVSQHVLLQDLRGERDDLHEVALAQLARDRPEDAGAARVVGCGEKHGRVLVEADQGPVRALVFLV